MSDAPVEPDVGEPKQGEGGVSALVDVPVITNSREGLVAGVATLDGTQRCADVLDAQRLFHSDVGGERGVLRDVPELAATSRSGVDFPDPFRPANPLRPAPKVVVKSVNTVSPSSQEKSTLLQTTDVVGVDMRYSE